MEVVEGGNQFVKDDYSVQQRRFGQGKGFKTLVPSKDYMMKKRNSRDMSGISSFASFGLASPALGGGPSSARMSARSRKSISPQSNRANQHQSIGATHSAAFNPHSNLPTIAAQINSYDLTSQKSQLSHDQYAVNDVSPNLSTVPNLNHNSSN